MRQILSAAALALALPASPVLAQQAGEGPGLFQRGLDAMIGQLWGEGSDTPPGDGVDGGPDGMAQDMAGALRRLAPVMQDLAAQVDDLRHYQTPQRLPNGDILIRRRFDAPPPPPLGDALTHEGAPDPAVPDTVLPDTVLPDTSVPDTATPQDPSPRIAL